MKTCATKWCVILTLFATIYFASGQGTAFVYQGHLNDNGQPASGSYDVSFKLYDNMTNGTLVAGPLVQPNVAITNGLFTATLDFGGAFDGNPRWLELAARTNGAASFTTLTPRQQLLPVPYAISAGNVVGTVAATQISGQVPLSHLPPNLLTNNTAVAALSGTFSGNGGGLTNISLASVGLAGLFSVPVAYTSAPVTLAVGTQPWMTVAADVNGDNKLDIVSADAVSGTLTVWTNAGGNSFGLNSSILVGGGPRSVAAADLNGDGRVDLISADWTNSIVKVFTNAGNGAFVFSSSLTCCTNPRSLLVLDVNGDSKPDLIWANHGGNTLTIVTNDGAGGLFLYDTLAVGSKPYYVTTGDFNGDGKLELICANINSKTLTLLTNNGAGSFASNATFNTGQGPTCFVPVDLNGDGKLDLACVNNKGTNITVFFNDGTGVLTSNASYTVGPYPLAIVALDVNGDGRMDLINSDCGDDTLTVLTNNGTGGFSVDRQLTVGNGPYGLTKADLNGDGIPDLIAANYGDNTVSVLFGSSPFGQVDSGTIVHASFIGNGAGLSNLNASQISGGVLGLAQLPGQVVTNNESGVTLGGTFTGDGSGLTNLNIGLLGAVHPSALSLPDGSVTNALAVTPDFSLVLAGSTVSNFSIALGQFSAATGTNSVAIGYRASATNIRAAAFGGLTVAGGIASTAMGQGSVATGFAATAIGNFVVASGDNSVAMGQSNNASAKFSVALGNATIASGWASTALGAKTIAEGGASTALGNHTDAKGACSTAMGTNTAANGFGSFAFGQNTIVDGSNSVAGGYRSHATNDNSFVWADGREQDFTSTAPNQFLIRANGNVGINTASPTATLDVNGSVRATHFVGDGSGLSNVGSAFAWQVPGDTSVQAAPNTGYLLTNSQLVTITLPTNCNPADLIKISGAGAGGWRIAQGNGQYVTMADAQSQWLLSSPPSPASWRAVACSVDGRIVYAAPNDGSPICYSTDGGSSWLPGSLSQSYIFSSVACSANGSHVVAGISSGGFSAGAILVSADSGHHWTQPTSPQETGSHFVAVSADGAKMVVVGNSVYTSTDFGATWTPANTPAQLWTSVACSADGNKIIAAAGMSLIGQICISPDGGTNWSIVSSMPTTNWSSVACSADGTKMAAAIGSYANTNSAGIYVSSDSGLTWTRTAAPFANWRCITCSSDARKWFAASDLTGIVMSVDSGVSWTSTVGPNQKYVCLACSSDGANAFAAALPNPTGGIYLYHATTTSGAGGYVIGSEGSMLELQYVGSGKFISFVHSGAITAF